MNSIKTEDHQASVPSLLRVGQRPRKYKTVDLHSVCVSFTLTCVTLLVLLGTRDDLFGECNIGDEIVEADKPIPVEHVEGVLGSKVFLPCDVRVPTRDDKLHMVLFFKQDDTDKGQGEEPIYRFDVRDKPSTDAKRSSVWGDRIYFQQMSEPAYLSIQDLQMRDEGMYRCRVDFKNSPTRNLRVNLTIIVPPGNPVIYDANSNIYQDSLKYNEDRALVLTCEVTGGRPRPTLEWWLENEMIDGDSKTRFSSNALPVIINQLDYRNLQRKHLGARFVCQARQTSGRQTINTTNFNLPVPKSATATIDLNLRPLLATITTKDSKLLAGKRYDIECVAVGSRPRATISWYINSRKMENLPITPPSEDANVTRSILSFQPSVEDDGKIMTCRADNDWIPGSGVEDQWRLNVQYAPKVMLQLGTNLVADDIKEGDDVYFQVSVRANPQPTRLLWFHNGKELRSDTSQKEKIIITNPSLVIQKISRKKIGNYSCIASNDMGSSQSNIVHLRVKYVPTCRYHTESLVGAMKHETVQIICEMESDPPSVQFRWTFNNSGNEIIAVPPSRYTSSGTTSTLNYTPISELDYGTLGCFGLNAVGKGETAPCYFQIVSAGRPFPLKNCTIFNKTEDSLSISCTEGFNGGLPQWFIIEVVDLQNKKIQLNGSSKIPLFSVDNMESGVVFRFIIYSVNDKGRSEPFILDGITFRGVAKLTGPTVDAELNPIFAILVGCTIVLIIFLTLAIIAIWKRSRRKKPPVAKLFRRDNESDNFQGEAALTKIDQNGLEEIGNPDVIPNKNDRSAGIRGFIRIHKTPPARRRKKDLEVKNNGETVALTLVETPDGELHTNHNHKSSLLTSSNRSSAPRESRI